MYSMMLSALIKHLALVLLASLCLIIANPVQALRYE